MIYFITDGENVKIGKADNPEHRLQALQTGHPRKLHLIYAMEGDLAEERILHKRFALLNVDREWFKYDDEIKNFINLSILTKDLQIQINEIDEKVEEIIDETEILTKRPRFKFSMIGLKKGDEITFIKDNNIKAIVADDDFHIILNDNRISLSESAKQLLGYLYPVQGTLYWTYNNESLDSIRNRIVGE